MVLIVKSEEELSFWIAAVGGWGPTLVVNNKKSRQLFHNKQRRGELKRSCSVVSLSVVPPASTGRYNPKKFGQRLSRELVVDRQEKIRMEDFLGRHGAIELTMEIMKSYIQDLEVE